MLLTPDFCLFLAALQATVENSEMTSNYLVLARTWLGPRPYLDNIFFGENLIIVFVLVVSLSANNICEYEIKGLTLWP